MEVHYSVEDDGYEKPKRAVTDLDVMAVIFIAFIVLAVIGVLWACLAPAKPLSGPDLSPNTVEAAYVPSEPVFVETGSITQGSGPRNDMDELLELIRNL